MGHEAIKLEIIEWLIKLEDDSAIEYLKIVKDSILSDSDWWDDIPNEQKKSIQRGLDDVDAGRVVAHDVVKRKYGL